VEAGLWGRRPAADGRGEGPGNNGSDHGSEKNNSVKNRVNHGSRGSNVYRGIMEAGNADRTVVVLASVIVMMENRGEG